MLKEDKQWDAWERSTVAQARAQDLSDVLDPDFVPSTPEGHELFVEKQKFVYAVFEKNLLTDKGKSLVRHYATTFDAQKVYRDISIYAKSSTQAAIEASTLLAYITSANCGDGSWKGTTQAFIHNWQDKIRQYELIIPTGDHFSETIKRTMLENAVGRVPELRAVKNQAAQHKTQNGGIELSYTQYCSLLASAAQEYDGSLIRDLNPPPSAARRSVYYQEMYDTEQATEDKYFDAYNIDSSPNDTLEANFTGFGGPRLNADQWSRLSKAAQAKWDEFTREEKAILLEQKVRTPDGNARVPPRRDFGKSSGSRFVPRSRPAHTAVSLHDISAADYIVFKHQMSIPESLTEYDDGIAIPPEPDPTVTPLFAHMTQKKDIPPSDIQRVLSQSMSKGGQTPARKSVVQDGVTYYANQHIQYRASSTHQVRTGALVDRGANGGIAGDDVRVINRTGRQVDVQGIDNHQIVDIPIVTAGAVVKTQRGEVIIILHQYAYTGKGKTIHSSGQMEWYKQIVDDKSVKVGGKQHIKTLEGYVIPLDIKSGLPYVKMRPYTDAEWDTLPRPGIL